LLPVNGLRAVLFDLDGTLRFNHPRFVDILFDYASHTGIVDIAKNRRQAMRWFHRYWAQSPELLENLKVFSTDDDAFWVNHTRLYFIACGCDPDEAERLAPAAQRRLKEDYKPEPWIPPDVPETLQALKNAGLTLGVVSNRPQSFSQEIHDIGLEDYFDLLLASGEIGLWKPDPAIFRYALEQLSVRPEQTVYVGDNYYADIVGARQAGLFPVLLDADEVFPDADCRVIQTIGELASLLQTQQP
jgi:putative hydrolase of the HAD superfamily